MNQNIINPTRPLEYVCFFSFEVPTKDGNAYVFLAVDAYSKFAFQTGVELNDNPETIIKHLYLLTELPDFAKQMGKGFTLVLHKYQEIEDKINLVINPVGGKILFDGNFLSKITMLVIKNMIQRMEMGNFSKDEST